MLGGNGVRGSSEERQLTVEDPPKRVRQTPPEKAPTARAAADVDAAEIRRRQAELLKQLAKIE